MEKALRYNKRLTTIFLLVAFSMLCSCAAVERTVQDNIFSSASPKFSITVSKDFNYLGTGASKYDLFYTSIGGEQVKQRVKSGEAGVDFYIFITKDIKGKGQTISKGIVVLIQSMPIWLPMKWSEPCYNIHDEQVSDYGVKLIGEEYYEFTTTYIKTNSNGYISKRLNKENYWMPNCYISKNFVRVDDLALQDDKKVKKEVSYFEDVALSGLDCSKWEKMKELSDKQLKYLKGFDERANKAMQINSVAKD
jgi:hypothetical protein